MEMQVRVLGNEDLLSKQPHIMCCYLKVKAATCTLTAYTLNYTGGSSGEGGSTLRLKLMDN